jgi:hypothetical protein
MKVAPEIIAQLCRERAVDLFTPVNWQGSPLDKVKLLWGISGVESSFGLNCNPKHENGYCYGGRYHDLIATHAWGCLAHCSFGPWQVMFANFPVGVSPLSLVWDADGRVASDLCIRGAIRVLNNTIARGARHLSDISIGYNGPAAEAEYSAKLSECWERPMPESDALVTA